MFSKVAFVVTLASFAILPYVLAHAVNDADTTAPVYLGSVDGKNFYADQQASMNWTEAKAHCNATGMHLGTVTSRAQYNLLMASFNSVTFNNDYWTAGRDAGSISQFAWDNSQRDMSATIIKPLDPPIMHTCLSLGILSDTEIRFDGIPCASKLHVLCQSYMF